ncbi:MAG: DNA repair protein RadA [Rhizobiaceae bacterium]
MAKVKIQYICQNCGSVHPKWEGRCDACGEWNTIVEETPSTGVASGPGRKLKKGRVIQMEPLDGDTKEEPRIITKISEFDRVTGGGLVRGSALLVGGDPGIGKSTLLMQVSASLAQAGHGVVYISGEEAVAQVRLRAQRLKVAESNVQLVAETNVENIVTTLEAMSQPPALVVIDSIQTLWTDTVESAPGTVTQVRSSAQAMVRYAKASGAAIVLVGHVTKDGQIAGPRVVEHMVDAVLYFEGEGGHHFRILRGVKNRFGPTDEIGVFEMSDLGLREVANPSELFLGERHKAAPGAAVFAGMEGRRPVLVEIQALVAESSLGTPRRAVVGWDSSRLAMILAVLEAHCGVRLGGHDVYLNVAGGFRITEPAADLAVAAALVSSLANKPLPDNSVFFAEVSLSGHLRPVAQAAGRLKEACKLGFDEATYAKGSETLKQPGLRMNTISTLADLVVELISGGDEALRQAADTGT